MGPNSFEISPRHILEQKKKRRRRAMRAQVNADGKLGEAIT